MGNKGSNVGKSKKTSAAVEAVSEQDKKVVGEQYKKVVSKKDNIEESASLEDDNYGPSAILKDLEL